MELSLVLAIANILVIPLASMVAYLLWNKITTIEKEQVDMADRIWKELGTVKNELNQIRYNYLNRFDDVKDILHQNHLQSMEKIAILETLLKQHIKTGE